MTVKELIAALAQFQGNLPVYFPTETSNAPIDGMLLSIEVRRYDEIDIVLLHSGDLCAEDLAQVIMDERQCQAKLRELYG